ncbi:MAG TPA: zf-HC2 domain-containing protein [Acidobacteriota bacterium]|nr:zf-HC2 domain-containing protein [Acidobacteriota bacterium]
MNCRSAESLFSALIEDELSQKERRFLEAHLLSCRKCSVSLKETRAAMEMFQSLPTEETSPHFEEDVMARIRSGEGLRPSLVEWLRGLLAPAWLRPVAVAGAGACAVWIAALVAGPYLNPGDRTAPVAVVTPAPSTGETSAPAGSDAPEGTSVAQGSVGPTRAPSSAELAGVTAPPSRPDLSASTRARTEEPADLATAPRETAGQGFAEGGDPSTPSASYVDEYITDQFYLERGNGGSSSPGITPVSGRPSDDVYIVF